MKIRTSTVSALIAREVGMMRPLATQRLFDDLFVIQDGFVNIFLIKDGEKYIAIDAGLSPDTMRAEMAKLNIAPADVHTVLLTHSDIDHVYGLGLFDKAEVYLPQAEVPMLGDFRITMTEAELTAAEQLATHMIAQGQIQEGQGLFGSAEYWPEDDIRVTGTAPHRTVSFLKNVVGAPFKTLQDGQVLTFGQTRIEAVQIDGHTKGLTSYRVNDTYLFVGDGLSLKEGRAAPFNAFLNRDEAQHRQSIGKIARMPGFSHIFTQHYGYSDNVAAAFAGWQE